VAVYDRRYRGYDGPITAQNARWMVLPRFAWAQVFKSRLFAGFFTLCFAWPFGATVWIYLHHNLAALANVGLNGVRLAPVNAMFFAAFMGTQCFLFGGLLTLIVGPGLVSPDLANGALPLYLSRPVTRSEYAFGKMATLAALLSLITWIPGLFLFLLQAWLEGWAWFADNLRIGAAIVLGAGIWIATISLLSMAASAVARRKVIAQTFLLGAIIFGSVAGQAINQMFNTRLGFVFALPELMHTVWEGLFQVSLAAQLPPAVAWTALFAICGTSIAVLARKLKAFEVVK
jgi:ABC-type transport system involved in multi-copper enzyme maturation permease subunit